MKMKKIYYVVITTFMLLFMQQADAQIYQQQFLVDSPAFNNRSMASSATSYVRTSSTTNSQATYLSSSNANCSIGITSGVLTIARTAGSATLSRNAGNTTGALMFRIDYNATTATSYNALASCFAVGNSFANSNSAKPFSDSSGTHSFFGIGTVTGTPATWKVHNGLASTTAGYVNGINSYNFATTQTILWVINNTGAALTYRAPNGTNESLGDDKYDVWVGTTRELNDVAAYLPAQSISNFAFSYRGSASGTQTLDNILVDSLPKLPISSAATSITTSGFTANWTAVSGVTGYRLDVATDAAFTNIVQSNVYVSGQATTSRVFTGLNPSTQYYYRVRSASQYTVDEFASGNSSSQTATTTCSNPSIGNPASTNYTLCQNVGATQLSVSATGASSYQWYSNSTASNSGGSAISGATSATYTPSTSSIGTLYYYCIALSGACSSSASALSGSYAVVAAPSPSFTTAPSATTVVGSSVTYTTQSGGSSYNWSVPGTSGVDYDITSGGIGSSDFTVTLTWKTATSKTVTVNYSNGSCSGASAASSTTNVTATTFYNKASSDVTVLSNWGLNTDGTGTAPADFTSAGLTFNMYNASPSMSTTWSPNGAGTIVNIGNGTNAVSFNASSAFTPTLVNVSNNASLQLSTSTIPTLGTIGASSTINYAGTSQTVTATSYGNLTISGSSANLSGTTNIAGTFTPGTATTSSGNIVLNGTSSSQAIPAFAYQSLTVSGADGKSTSGSLTVAGSLTMTNSFNLTTGHTLLMDSTGSMTSTAAKTLTVNGTFDRRFASTSNAFSAGSGVMQIASGGTFRISGISSGNNGSPTQTAFTNVNFASGTSGGTLHVTASAAPRIPSAVAGNVIWDVNAPAFAIYNLVGSTSNTIGGHLTVASTGQSILSLAGGTASRALTVSGNLYMPNGGRFDLSTYSTTAITTATGANVLTVNGDVILNDAADTLYTTSSPTASASGTINIKGNLVHTAGVIGKASSHRSSADLTGTVASASNIVINGTSSQDITTTGTIENNTNVTVNNAAGVRMLTNMTINGSVTLTSGLLRTNGNTLTVSGTSVTPFTGTSFGSAATSYVAICDASGTTSSTGGVTVTNIGIGGRTGTILFPIGATPTSYNPLTVNNSSAAVDFTTKVKNTSISGISIDSSVQRTWNILPASGSPSSVIALQWAALEEGNFFTRTSAAIAHSTGSTIDVQSSGSNAAGTNPYSLSSGATSFTSYGDFGVSNGVVALATEPTVQASNVILGAGVDTMNISWMKGSDASNSVVIIKAASSVSTAPVDATSYTASTVFGSGTAIGGGFVAYTSTGNSVKVTGLTPNTTYNVSVYSFNTAGGAENYLTSTAGASSNATTGLYTYYYVAAAGGTGATFAWNTASKWATSLGGTPLAAFTPSNNDVYIFDGSNLGTTASPYTAAVSVAAFNNTNVIGKIIVKNNAIVTIASYNSATTITLGNSSFSANTPVLNVESGSTLSFNGSAFAGINLQSNSSANISGTLNLGNATNVSLVPNATGSTITFNSGAVCESNQSSSATTPFGTSGSGLVIFSNGSTFKHTRGTDAFGGAGASVASFATNSLYWFNNSTTTSSFTLDGRTYGNVRVATSASPVAGANGFTIYNLELTGTGTKLSTAFTGTNNHIKGNITIPATDTLRFNPTSASTLNFSGNSAQTATINSSTGFWQVISTCLQSYLLSNTAGLSLDGSMNLGQVSGTSFTINSGTNLSLVSGTLTVNNNGALNVNGTISRTSGTITQSSTTAPIVFSGMSNIPSGLFASNTARTLEINRSTGITLNSDLTISNSLTLTNGAVTTGSNTVIMSTGATVTRTNGWINGNLRKNVSSGSNVARTFEIGDASNYLPVNMTFASVTTAGDVALTTQTPATAYANYATAPISTINYINRYWTLTNVNTLAFTNYGASFNWLAGDAIGTATTSSVLNARYNSSSWSKGTAISTGSTSDSIAAASTLGTLIFANDCITLTPTVSITSTTTAVCTGSTVTFTANASNSGTTPIYRWKKNGTPVIGTNSATLLLNDYEVTSGDNITCTMRPNNNCQTTDSVVSNSISLIVGTVTPSVSIVTNTTPICSGSATTFTATGIDGGPSPIYTWKRNNITAGTGASITFLAGTLTTGDTISCVLTANNACQTIGMVTSNKIGITVNTSPTTSSTINYKTGVSISSAVLCAIGDTIYFRNYTAGGVWATSNAVVATNTTASYASGQISYSVAQAAGIATISFNKTSTNGCSASASVLVTVAPITAPAAITGASAVCTGSTIALSTTATGGVWSSTAPSYASVNTSGLVTGRSAGALTIRYTISNSAGCSIFSEKSITTNALPATPSIGYKAPFSNPQAGAPTGGFCVGKVFGVLGTPTSGVWSSNGCISVTNLGIATINTTGAGSLTYTFTNTNGCVNSRTMTGTGFACAARGIVANNEKLETKNEFSIFPNPAKSVVYLKVETLVGQGQIIVTDLYGKTVKSQPLSMGNNTIDIANLSKGMYFVATITSEGKTTKKLVVE